MNKKIKFNSKVENENGNRITDYNLLDRED